MTDATTPNALAFVPYSMREAMRNLPHAVTGHLVICANIEDLTKNSAENEFAVVLIPAIGLPTGEWWSLWGLVSAMEPHPSILVYALESDFLMWAGVLDAGGYDVLVAPFTTEKLRESISSAAEDFVRRL